MATEISASPSMCETTRIRTLLRAHPETLRVFIAYGVPAAFAERTIDGAAQALGESTDALLRELRRLVGRDAATTARVDGAPADGRRQRRQVRRGRPGGFGS